MTETISRSDLLAYGEEILRKKPVMRKRDFEDAIKAKFGEQLDAEYGDRKLTGSNRLAKDNELDWVKATFTRQGQIFYCGDWMIYLPVFGQVGHDKREVIVTHNDAKRVIYYLMQR